MKHHLPLFLLLLMTVCVLCLPISAENEHRWNTPAFVWSSDASTATAYQSCADCTETRSVTAFFIAVDRAEATCQSDGAITRTAYATLDGITFTDTATEPLPKREHRYTAPTFHWNPSDFTCLAEWVCTVGDETEYADCSVTKTAQPPNDTCYLASVTVGTTVYTDTYLVPGLADIHNYGTPEIQWSADFRSANAVAVCTLCAADDPAKTLTAACAITEDTTPPTCTANGRTVLTARAVLLDTVVEDQKTLVLPQLAHQYTVPQFVWNGTLCDAFYTCSIGGETAIAACEISETHLTASCTEPGTAARVASVTVDGITYTDRKEVSVPAKGHTAQRIEGYAPSCTSDGLSDGLRCADCSMILTEQTILPAADHTRAVQQGMAPTCTLPGLSAGVFCTTCDVVLEQQTVLPSLGHTPHPSEPTAPTCTEPGSTGETICTVCDTVLTEAVIVPATGHRYGSVVFTWSHDGMTVYAVKACSGTCGTQLHGAITLTRTEEENGTTVTATAVFPDGSTEQETKFIEAVLTPSEPSEPTAPSGPSEPESPTDPTTPTTPAKPNEPALPPFTDVPPGSYYEDAVIWAAQTGITQGTSASTFSPDMICTRAQVVTMLWRAAGAVVSNSTVAFTDTAPSAYYYHAVVWAAEVGITEGTSETTFSPDLLCSRAQIVTMLWRAAGCPRTAHAAQFSDVAQDAWYADAVAWAVANGITLGTGADTFSPDAVCTRAQIVTFLYRAQN